jgi:undecaprenyl pyrophosphate phosphatase UppP
MTGGHVPIGAAQIAALASGISRSGVSIQRLDDQG